MMSDADHFDLHFMHRCVFRQPCKREPTPRTVVGPMREVRSNAEAAVRQPKPHPSRDSHPSRDCLGNRRTRLHDSLVSRGGASGMTSSLETIDASASISLPMSKGKTAFGREDQRQSRFDAGHRYRLSNGDSTTAAWKVWAVVKVRLRRRGVAVSFQVRMSPQPV